MLETPITEAKNTFTALVHQVEGGEVVHLTRHGRPVAVILSEVEYQELRQHSTPRGDLLDFVRDWRGDLPETWCGLSDSEIDAARDRARGLDFAWEA